MINWLTLEKAANYLKSGKSTIYKLARENNIPAHTVIPVSPSDAGDAGIPGSTNT